MSGNSKKNYIIWRWIRIASQTLFLLLFLFLFIKTDYAGTDELEYAVNIFFRLDPLVAACAIFAGKTFILLFLPALLTLVLSLIFGRFFCGWFCPMGTMLDATNTFWRQRRTTTASLGQLKYSLLVIILVGAFFGFPVVGYFDPFSLLVRGLTLSGFPAFNNAVTSFFTFTYQQAPDWLNQLTEPLYALLKETILPFKQKYYHLSILSLGMLLTVFCLEKFGRRFFCRNVCPLGAFLSLPARFAFFRGSGGLHCGKCKVCRKVCRMEAIDDERQVAPEKCNLCLDCLVLCPQGSVQFGFSAPVGRKPQFDGMSRRVFIGSLLTGVFIPALLRSRVHARSEHPLLIRPPGALAEKDFLGACVRCGECMKVCINNALQPTFLEAGLEGMFTPKLIPRFGYCEYSCSLCGQVCPSGAIKSLPIVEKKRNVIGRAHFDKNRCLPYAKGVPCIVCEEHCPTPEKAIKFKETIVTDANGVQVQVKQPYLVDKLCIGCGICENKCPLSAGSAVIVTSDGESRNAAKNYIGGSYIYYN